MKTKLILVTLLAILGITGCAGTVSIFSQESVI